MAESRFGARTALVTGAAGGLGRAAALRLAAEGADVVACDLASDPESPSALSAALAETAELVGATGRRCLVQPADVRERTQLEGAVKQTVSEFGRLDILVACAGVQTYASLFEMDDAMWDRTLAVNLTGVANSIRAVMGQMVEQKYGRIVAVGSIGGRRGTGTPHYSASKWGVIGFAKSASLALHPHGITVNVVNPGSTATPMTENASFRDFVGADVSLLPPEAIADAIAYLAAESSGHISGSAIDVAGDVSPTYTA